MVRRENRGRIKSREWERLGRREDEDEEGQVFDKETMTAREVDLE